MPLDQLLITFPVSGITTYVFIPTIVAFTISFFSSTAGISGAFLLLPFQVSILGFTSPAVTSTNMFYNVIGTPGGVMRYAREKRLVWPLVGSIILGTLPGVLIGYLVRIHFMPDPRIFKLFVGMVLLVVGYRLMANLLRKIAMDASPGDDRSFETCDLRAGIRSVSFSFLGTRYCFSVPGVFVPSLAVGVVSGIYGIGGGAIIAPYLVSVFRLPVYTIAGAVLGANFMTSLAGICFYSTLPFNQGQTAPPDWLLGALFGIGGLLGMYCGAKCQRFLPERTIKIILAGIIFIISAKYIFQYF